MLHHAVRLNTCTEIAITKLDVLAPLARAQGLRRVRGRGRHALRPRAVPPVGAAQGPARSTRRCPAGASRSTDAERIEDLPARGARLRALRRGARGRARHVRLGRARPASRPSCCPAPPDMRVLVVGSGGREHALAGRARPQRARSTRSSARRATPGWPSWAAACRSTSTIAAAVAALADAARRRSRGGGSGGAARRGRVDALEAQRPRRLRARGPRRRGSRARRRG